MSPGPAARRDREVPAIAPPAANHAPALRAPDAAAPVSGSVAPLSDALSSLVSSIRGDDEGLESRGRVDPAEVLALTLDLTGSMKLDAHLKGRVSSLGIDPRKRALGEQRAQGLMDASAHDDGGAVPDPEPGQAVGSGAGCGSDGSAEVSSPDDPAQSAVRIDQAAQVLREELLGRFGRIEEALRRRLRELPTGRSALADAERLLTEIGECDGWRRRNARALAAIARAGCESYLVAIAGALARLRGDARALRAEARPALRRIGAGAARLEDFDSLLSGARFRFTSQLYSRIPAALAAHFADGLLEAIRALDADGDAPEPSAVEAWYVRGGWISEYQALATRIVLGALDHERNRLLDLVEGARDAAHEEANAGIGGALDTPGVASLGEGS